MARSSMISLWRKQLTLPGYYAGNDEWKIAFMPTDTGQWTFTTSSADSDLSGVTGTIDVVSSGRIGMLKSDPAYPKKWKYTDGDYVVPIGVFIQIMHGAGNATQFEALGDFLQTNNIHLINFRLCEQDICFLNDNPSSMQMDLTLWDRLEERLEILAEHGVGVDIMLYTDDAGKPSYGAQSAQEQFLVRYLVARVASFPVVNFNTGIDINEYRGGSGGWHDWYGNLVKSLDPYGHPVSSRGGPDTGGASLMTPGVQTYNSAGSRNSDISGIINAFNYDDVPAMNNDNWGEDKTGINGHTAADIRRAAWKASTPPVTAACHRP